jgi:tRNA threonylcarbamoyladenosine biosynthesis protein TsaE
MSAILERLRAGVVTRSPEETRALAAELARALPADTTLALHGNLGVGKTTFVQGLARGFGLTDAVTSPTFALFTLHRGGSRSLVHFDAYRLDNSAQVEALMLDEFLAPPYCLAVEWPEKVSSWLPADAWHLHLAIEPDGGHSIRLG